MESLMEEGNLYRSYENVWEMRKAYDNQKLHPHCQIW